jgi:hypothetical protein
VARRKLTDQPPGDVGLRPLPRGVPAPRDAPPRSRGHRPVTPRRKARAARRRSQGGPMPVGPGQRHLAHGLDPSPHASPVTDASARLCPPAGTLKPSAGVSASEPEDPPGRQAVSRRTSSPELIRRAAETAALADARRGRGRLVLVPDFSHDPLQPPGPKPRPPTLYGSSWDASYRLDSEQSAVRISSPRRPGTHLPPQSTGAPGQATLGHLPLPQLGRRIHRAILPQRPPERSKSCLPSAIAAKRQNSLIWAMTS